MDERLSEVAGKAGFVYSRYADDLAFSSRRQLDRKSCREVIASASAILDVFGFSVNSAKTSVRPPGSRKVLLGLNANSVQPRLSRELRDRLLRHRYFLLHPQIGPAKHAKRLGFDSTIGFKNHLFGLVAYAAQVEPGFAMVLKEDLAQISWPL
ncbi:hypothetical protein HDE80_002792 [Rhodanobacter sp. A1T4]|nr:hypothetical protein [Rhodanobacter sp. A1T4]